MSKEVLRQCIHAVGFAFVLIASFLKWHEYVAMFFGIAVFFYIYGKYVKRKKNHLFGFRKLFLYLERDGVRPFSGAFWFYIGSGITFFIFPLRIASAAVTALAIGDSISTVIGKRFGKVKINGNKTLEGSLAFFASVSIASLLFVNSVMALLTGFVAAVIEALVPDRKGRKWYMDDNLLIPIVTGFILFGVSLVL